MRAERKRREKRRRCRAFELGHCSAADFSYCSFLFYWLGRIISFLSLSFSFATCFFLDPRGGGGGERRKRIEVAGERQTHASRF